MASMIAPGEDRTAGVVFEPAGNRDAGGLRLGGEVVARAAVSDLEAARIS
jgi:hypothetical protein